MFAFFLCFEEKGGPKHKEFTGGQGSLGGGVSGKILYVYMPFFGVARFGAHLTAYSLEGRSHMNINNIWGARQVRPPTGGVPNLESLENGYV